MQGIGLRDCGSWLGKFAIRTSGCQAGNSLAGADAAEFLLSQGEVGATHNLSIYWTGQPRLWGIISFI